MNTTSNHLADDAELVNELAQAGNRQAERAAAIDRIACRVIEQATGIGQVPTYRTRGPLPTERIQAIEKLARGHRDPDSVGLRSVTLSPQLAGAIAIQLADFAEAIDENQHRSRRLH